MLDNRQTRWGVIGCGQISVDKSVPGLLAAEGARLVAVADPIAQRRALAVALAMASGVNGVRDYEKVDDLLAADDIDAVYIALPTGMHADAVAAAAKAGKAILCEKPLGRTAIEVRNMARVARDAKVPLMTAYMSRFGDPFQEAVRLLAEKRIGQVTFVSAHFSYPAMGPYPPHAPGGWRWTDAAGGGPLLDIGVYLAFGLRELLGDRIARVGAFQCNTIAPPEAAVHDTSVAWFQTDGGIPGTFAATFSHSECSITFYGTNGRLHVGNIFSQSPTGRIECVSDGVTQIFEAVGKAVLPHYENYRREFAHFSMALLNGESFRPSPSEVLDDALLLDALATPAAAGAARPVPTAAQFMEARS